MIALQQLVRTYCAALLGFFVFYYFNLAEGYWLILTAVLFVQINPDNFSWRDLVTPVISGIVLAANVLLIYFLLGHYLFLASLLFFITFLCVYLGLIKSELFLPTVLINILVIVAAGIPTNSVELRMQFIIFGSLLALLMKILFWPPGIKRHLRIQLANYLHAINQLQKTLFWIYVARNYSEKHYFYEKELHRKRLCVLRYLENIKSLDKKLQTKKNIIQLERMFEITIALGDMRYRVKDFTTFEMSEKEFIAISNSLSKLFNQAAQQILFGKKLDLDCSTLMENITAFEDITRGTLQVASAEPMVFVIFIQYLRAMTDELSGLTSLSETS